MLGEPAEDRFQESFGMKVEHMIFVRAGQADRPDRRSRGDKESRGRTAAGYFRLLVTSRDRWGLTRGSSDLEARDARTAT
jgi:hypothetical protein